MSTQTNPSIESTSNNPWWHHAVVILGFLLIASIFCLPQLQGKQLLPHDIEQWLKMSRETRDIYSSTGEYAFWTNTLFGGMPSTLTDFYSKDNWFANIKDIIFLYKHGEMLNPIFLFFWGMVAFYILTRTLNLNKWLSAGGAVAFAFSTYNPIIIVAGHTTKLMDITLLPGLLAGIILCYQGRYLLGAIVSALFLSVIIDAGHYQIIYYSIFVILFLAITEFIKAFKNGTIKQFTISSAILIAVAAIVAGGNAQRLLLTNEVNEFTIRGNHKELGETEDKGLDKSYAFKWSNGTGELLGTMVPNLYGGGFSLTVDPQSSAAKKLSSSIGVRPEQVGAVGYWGAQQADGLAGSIYFGITVMFLAILGLITIRSVYKWWLLGSAVFFMLISLGKNFEALNYFLFDTLPLMNKFRSPNMALSISSVMFPILAVWGIHELIFGQYSKAEILKKFKLSLFITGGIMLFIGALIYFVFDYNGPGDSMIFGDSFAQVSNHITAYRKSLASADWWRSIIFIVIVAGIIWGFIKEKINASITVLGISVLMIIDILPVAHRYMNESKYLDAFTYKKAFEPRRADVEIMKDKGHYRVLDLSVDMHNSANPSYFHNNIGGYHPAKLQVYQDLISYHISGNGVNSAVLNMLNTKYIIVPGQKEAQVAPFRTALGNAWFVPQIATVKTAQEEIMALRAPSIQKPDDTTAGQFNPKIQAILRETEWAKIGNKTSFVVDSQSTITLKNIQANKLTFESNNAHEGFAVFSEIYYPKNWVAKIDGKESPIIRTNYALRGLLIPAGQHTIEMEFMTPEPYAKYAPLALASSVIIALLVLFGIFTWVKGMKK